MMNQDTRVPLRTLISYISIPVLALIIQACGSSAAENVYTSPPPTLPVIAIHPDTSVTYQEFAASLEGRVNVEIRPQVDGSLEKIYVDEGAYVTAGQPLFLINDRPYREQLTNARSGLLAAKANMEKALVEVNRLEPLVKANVVADVQLQTAQAAYNAAKAQVTQAESMVENARIILDYTLIKAPVTGYIGRIPYKKGSLVGRGEIQPLTVLSDVNEMYAYFSMSEVGFIQFSKQYQGKTIEEKLKNAPPVELVLADHTVYDQKGSIELIEGQFDKTVGAITFRATFPNPGRILRTGNTGKVKLPYMFSKILLVPQKSTFEIQDKVFLFTVGDSNKVYSKPISVSGKSGQYYIIENGIKEGDRIVVSGIGTLRDGVVIKPNEMSAEQYNTDNAYR